MEKMTEQVLDSLRNNLEPVIRWKFVKTLGKESRPAGDGAEALKDLAKSPFLSALLADRDAGGKIPYPAYDKWFGSHWVLSILADLEYPAGDSSLTPMLEQCYGVWLSEEHKKYIRTINQRVRRCASQEGNCIYYSLKLGLADARTDELADRLVKWQWNDGGWNCDKRPEAATSSFNETLIPLRGLAHYAKATGDPNIQRAVERAAEVFLSRRLFKKLKDHQIIDQNFVILHYPNYWHYDILFALKVMAEAGLITDPRCDDALDLLESKRLPDGGFPAEGRYYRHDAKRLSGHSRVDWGGTSIVRSNPFVSLDGLYVLKQAGRLIA